jgi:hypothetical protein
MKPTPRPRRLTDIAHPVDQHHSGIGFFRSDPEIGWRVGRPKAPGGAGYCFVGLGSGGGVGDNRFAVADDDVLVGERLQLDG